MSVRPTTERIAAKFTHPVAVADHDDLGRFGLGIFGGEQAASGGGNAEKRKQRVGDVEPLYLFGLVDAGDAVGVALVHGDVLEALALLAIDEIVRGRHVEVFDLDAGGGVPDADEAVGLGIGKRLEEDAFDDAENEGVGADAGGEGDEGDGGEERGEAETAEDLFELLQEGLHGRSG